MKRICSGLIAVAAFLFHGPLTAAELPATVITEDDALALFYDRNLDLIAARFNIEDAQAQQIVAAAIPNPTLSSTVYEISKTPNKMPAFPQGKGLAYGVQISQLIETAGRRGLRMEASEAGTAVAENEFANAVRVFSNAVRHAYYGLFLSQETNRLLKDIAARYQDLLKANRLRLDAGDISESEYLRIEVEGFKAKAELDNSEATLQQARAELSKLLGFPPNSMEFVAKTDWRALTVADGGKSEDALVEAALHTRPDLKANRLRIEQAEKQLTLARRLNIPDVTVTAGWSHDPSNNVSDTEMVGISMPIPLFYQHKGEVGQAVAALNTAQVDAERTTQAIRTEVIKSKAAWRSADAIAQRFEGEVMRRLNKIREAAEFAYAHGAASLLDLIDAQRNYRAMMLDYFAALSNRALARADLLMALGEEEKR